MKTASAILLAILLPAQAHADLNVPPVLQQVSAKSAATPSAASSLTVSSALALLGLTITAPVAGFAMAFDASSAPADGVVTPGGCWYVPPPISVGQSATISMANTPTGVGVTSGFITVVFSTTGCFVKTASPAYISVTYQ